MSVFLAYFGMRITRFSVEHYRSESAPYRWRDGLAGGKGGPGQESLLRVSTDTGIDGIVWMSSPRVSQLILEDSLGPMLTRFDPWLREQAWYEVWERDRIEEFPLYALAYIDVALWDIQSKAAGVPLYRMLGGHKSRAKAYASTVTMDTEDDYLRLADRCLDRGYRAIKLHVWGRIQEDCRLVRRLRGHVGPDIDLMLDGSGGYTFDESLRLGRAMEAAGYLWLEEPMREFSLDAYEKLGAALDIPILGAECTDGCHFNAAEWVRRRACDRLRTSWYYKGGFTGALKVAHLAEAFQLQADVHGGGWGSLHLVCALPNSLYYESLVPEESFGDATLAGIPLPDEDGWVYPNETPGIGWEPDPARRLA